MIKIEPVEYDEDGNATCYLDSSEAKINSIRAGQLVEKSKGKSL